MFQHLCDAFFDKEIAEVIKAQSNIKPHLISKKIYPNPDSKFFYLYFYHASPMNYTAMQKLLNLPSKRTLLAMCRCASARGIDQLMQTLKPKIQVMSDSEKYCSVLVGEVQLKPHLYYHVRQDRVFGLCESLSSYRRQVARRGFVFILRGILEPWVLPVDYALLSQDDDVAITHWFHTVLSVIIGAGLKVRLCISNMDPHLLTGTNLSVEKPYFSPNDSNHCKIFFAYDTNYLMRSVYRRFMDSEFHYQGSVAKWQDVLQFYESDSMKEHRLAPELSKQHVSPTENDKMKTRFAAETLSERVAAGISTYVDFGQMEESARGTVKILTMMGRIYKFMNSSSAPNTCKYQKPYTGSKFMNVSLVEYLTILREIKVISDGADITSNVDCLKQLQITIRSVMFIFENLCMEANISKLNVKNLSFDIFENFHRRILESSKRKDITAWRLVLAYRKMLFRNILKPSKGKTCKPLISEIIQAYLGVEKEPDLAAARANFKISTIPMTVKMADYQDLDLPADCQLIPLCVLLLEKCNKLHVKCCFPKTKLRDETHTRYTQFTGEPMPRRAVGLPDDKFIEFIERLDDEVKLCFDGFWRLRVGVLFGASLELLAARRALIASYVPPCPCFPVSYLIQIFFRLRISQQLKENNRRFKHCEADHLTFQYVNLSK